MTLFSELKRRKVFRVGLAYLVAAWLVAQVAELVADSFGAPDWVMQLLLVLLLLGLPVVAFLAWVFELTPGGLVRDEDVSPAVSASSSRLLSAVTIVLLVLALGYFIWESRFAGNGVPAQAVNPAPADAQELGRSIAVLPFENLSGDPADGYFADGLADTLLHKLAQIEDLRVIARNSSFQFKGSNRDVREIGKILDVGVVLEGTVQRAGDQVRIIAQLVRTSDGSHVWSQTFDGSMENIFALQDTVAESIADQLQVDLTTEERRRMLRNGTDSPEAYNLLMRAVNEDPGNRSMADAEEADWPPIALLKQALVFDPNYASAWAALSDQYNRLAHRSGSSQKYEEYTQQAWFAAQRAVEIDPDLYLGHSALGWAAHREGKSLEAARHFRRALELEPNAVTALSGLALQLVVSDPGEALQLLDRAQSLSPTTVIFHRQKYFAYSRLGRYDEAISELQEAIRKSPDEPTYFADLADMLIARRGRPDEAARYISQLLRQTPDTMRGLEAMAHAWLAGGHAERSAEWSGLLLSRFPDLDSAKQFEAERLLGAGAYEEALERLDTVQSMEERAGEGYQVRAIACLQLRQAECALQQVQAYADYLEWMKTRGAAWMAWTANRQLLELLAREAAGKPLEAAALGQLETTFANERFFDTKFYARAGVAVRRGDIERSLRILEESLNLADGGVINLDLLGLDAEVSPLLDPLRGQPAFADWLQRFRQRRDAMRERMLVLETATDILPPAAVEKLIAN